MSSRAGDGTDKPISTASTDEISEDDCKRCSKPLCSSTNNIIKCDKCATWFHIACVGVTITQARHYRNSEDVWTCMNCSDGKSNEQLLSEIRNKKKGRPPKRGKTPPIPAQQDKSDDPNCPICRQDVVENEDGLCCERCLVWTHRVCLMIDSAEYDTLSKSSEPWYCVCCKSVMANKLKWGTMVGED